MRKSIGPTMACTCLALGLAAVAAMAPGVGGHVLPPVRSDAVAATVFEGQPRVVDGDTLVVHGRRIRMFGIDAPESLQDCTRDGQTYRCGGTATAALIEVIAGRPVSCAEQDVDRYGRSVGKCRVGETDLGAWMVSHGWAVAYTYYSKIYLSEEDAARAAHRGVWAGDFEFPWQWRREQRSQSATVARARDDAAGLIASAPGSI